MIRLKRKLARAITSPVVGKIARRFFRERVPGSGAITRTTDVDDRTVASIMFGFYEAGERRFIHRYLSRDLDVIELGGSLGIVTHVIRRHVTAERRIVTVEADPVLAEKLAARFESSPNVRVVHGAVDYSGSGETTRFSRGDDNLSGRLGAGARVPRKSLSGLLESHGITAFSLVCDIEGAEAGILSDDAKALRACRHVIIETHETAYRGRIWNTEEFRARFEALGFRVLAQHGPIFAFTRD